MIDKYTLLVPVQLRLKTYNTTKSPWINDNAQILEDVAKVLAMPKLVGNVADDKYLLIPQHRSDEEREVTISAMVTTTLSNKELMVRLINVLALDEDIQEFFIEEDMLEDGL